MDISVTEFNSRYKDSGAFIIIDVREKLEFQTFNLGGDNIPLDRLLREVAELPFSKESEIIVICQRGMRSETAKRSLVLHGYNNVRNLTGGLLAWRRSINNAIQSKNG